MLSGLRRAGKKVFLLTNSLFDYTQVVMSHMYQCFLRDQHESSGQSDKDVEKPNSTWMDYFDVIIAGGNKPAFLLDEGYVLSHLSQFICIINATCNFLLH